MISEKGTPSTCAIIGGEDAPRHDLLGRRRAHDAEARFLGSQPEPPALLDFLIAGVGSHDLLLHNAGEDKAPASAALVPDARAHLDADALGLLFELRIRGLDAYLGLVALERSRLPFGFFLATDARLVLGRRGRGLLSIRRSRRGLLDRAALAEEQIEASWASETSSRRAALAT